VCRRAVRIAGLRDPLCAAEPVGSIAAFAVTTRLAGNVACDVACDVASDSNIDLALVVTRSARERPVLRCAALRCTCVRTRRSFVARAVCAADRLSRSDVSVSTRVW
jgi:hypothetical protein